MAIYANQFELLDRNRCGPWDYQSQVLMNTNTHEKPKLILVQILIGDLWFRLLNTLRFFAFPSVSGQDITITFTSPLQVNSGNWFVGWCVYSHAGLSNPTTTGHAFLIPRQEELGYYNTGC